MTDKQGFWDKLWNGPTEIRSAGNPNGDGMLPGVIPPVLESGANRLPTLAECMGNSAVYASINVLVNWVTGMELTAFRTLKGNTERIALPTFLSTPKIDENDQILVSQYDLLKQAITSLAVNGNAYILNTRTAAGAVYQLEVLNPGSMTVALDRDNEVEFRYQTTNGQKTYNSKRITHIKTFCLPGELTGRSPLQVNAEGLRRILAMDTYTDSVFGPKAKYNFYLKSSRALDDDEIARASANITRQINSGQVPVMDNDWTIMPLGMSPADAQYLQQQAYAKTEVATYYNIPAGLVLADSGATGLTYQNLNLDARLFITNGLATYTRPIEQALSALLPRGTEVRFSTEALLKADTTQRYEAHKSALGDQQWKTVNEVRTDEGLQPITGGNELAAPAPVQPPAEAPVDEPKEALTEQAA